MEFEKINSDKFKKFSNSEISNLHLVIGGWFETNPANPVLLDRTETLQGTSVDGIWQETRYVDDHIAWGY